MAEQELALAGKLEELERRYAEARHDLTKERDLRREDQKLLAEATEKLRTLSLQFAETAAEARVQCERYKLALDVIADDPDGDLPSFVTTLARNALGILDDDDCEDGDEPQGGAVK